MRLVLQLNAGTRLGFGNLDLVLRYMLQGLLAIAYRVVMSRSCPAQCALLLEVWGGVRGSRAEEKIFQYRVCKTNVILSMHDFNLQC